MSKEIVEKIKSIEWHSDWSGAIPLIDICMAPGIYTYGFQKLLGKGYNKIFVTFKDGIASGRFPQNEYNNLGMIAASKFSDSEFANNFIENFRTISDEIIEKIKADPKSFLKGHADMRSLYGSFGSYCEVAKLAFNFLDDDFLETKKSLEEARKYIENFYQENFKAYDRMANMISIETDFDKKLILMMTSDELIIYSQIKDFPEESILLDRYLRSGAYWDNGKLIFISAKEVDEVEKFWKNKFKNEQLTGVTAYPGLVKGRCKIVLDFRGASLAEGEILVTGMTNPDFVVLMKKAGAIISDGGGMLCHAAIVARELKKPCIIGTKIATQVLHDGDLVEVDADNGIVKIIRKS